MQLEHLIKDRTVPEIELRYSLNMDLSDLPLVTSAKEAYQILLANWDRGKIGFVGQSKVLLLNQVGRVLGICTLTSATSTCTVTDPKLIFAAAITANASRIILAHNHPSGPLTPNNSEKAFTAIMKQAGLLLELPVVDSIIVTTEGYYSFCEEGEM